MSVSEYRKTYKVNVNEYRELWAWSAKESRAETAIWWRQMAPVGLASIIIRFTLARTSQYWTFDLAYYLILLKLIPNTQSTRTLKYELRTLRHKRSNINWINYCFVKSFLLLFCKALAVTIWGYIFLLIAIGTRLFFFYFWWCLMIFKRKKTP